MNFNEVDIFYFYTGWNGIYPDSTLDVDSPLGAFTWRRKNSELPSPSNSSIIAHIHLDRDANPVNTIALAIIDYLRGDSEEGVAVEVAQKLVEKIVAARNKPSAKPPPHQKSTVLDFKTPLSDSVTD